MDATKFPEDQLKTVLCMLAAYPLSFLLRLFPNSPNLKHAYNFILGVFFCVYTLGRWSWLHLFFSSLVSYLILLVFSPKVSHKLVFVWAMSYITVRYIQRLHLFQKLVSFNLSTLHTHSFYHKDICLVHITTPIHILYFVLFYFLDSTLLLFLFSCISPTLSISHF